MIKIVFNPELLKLVVEGHSGYAPEGQDIICAAASTLSFTLAACLASEENYRANYEFYKDAPMFMAIGHPRMMYRTLCSELFEWAATGYKLLAEKYPEFVEYKEVMDNGNNEME